MACSDSRRSDNCSLESDRIFLFIWTTRKAKFNLSRLTRDGSEKFSNDFKNWWNANLKPTSSPSHRALSADIDVSYRQKRQVCVCTRVAIQCSGSWSGRGRGPGQEMSSCIVQPGTGPPVRIVRPSFSSLSRDDLESVPKLRYIALPPSRFRRNSANKAKHPHPSRWDPMERSFADRFSGKFQKTPHSTSEFADFISSRANWHAYKILTIIYVHTRIIRNTNFISDKNSLTGPRDSFKISYLSRSEDYPPSNFSRPECTRRAGRKKIGRNLIQILSRNKTQRDKYLAVAVGTVQLGWRASTLCRNKLHRTEETSL